MPNGEPTGAGAPKAGGATLEQRLSIFDSIGNSIDSLVGAVRAIPEVVKKTAQYTYYSAKAALGLAAGVALAGAIAGYSAFLHGAKTGLSLATAVLKAGYSALILPAGIAAGTWLANLKNKTETTFKQMANELAIGGVLGGLLHYIFLGSRYLVSTAKSAYGTAVGFLTGAGCSLAQVPPFLATHEYLNRALIKDYKPKPLKDIGKQIKKMWPIMPPMLANFTVVPDYLGPTYQMPVAAGVSVAYGLLKAEKKQEEKKQKAPAGYTQPQLAGAPGYGM